MSDKHYCVYKHTSPSGKVYIGITKHSDNANSRWQNGRGYIRCPAMARAIKKYGFDSFSHEVIESGLSKEEAGEREQYWVSYFHSNNPSFGYNLTSGGDIGRELSDESKRKIAAYHIGRKSSAETRAKISAAALSRPPDYERLEKMHDAVRGKPIPEERIARISSCLIGHPVSNETRKKLSDAAKVTRNRCKRVICIETGKVFESARAAAKSIGKAQGSITSTIFAGCKCGGYHWKYLDKNGESSMSISPENTHANIVMPKKLKEKLMQMAREQNRSFGNYVVTILQEHVKSVESR